MQTFLYVDDSPENREIFQFAFQRADIGKSLQLTGDGREAIDYLLGTNQFADRTQYPLPALVVLDLKMPNLNGHETLAWIRSQPAFQKLIVVMFSSSGEPEEI